MKKVVINLRHGGFGLSEEATRMLAELGNDAAKKYVTEYDGKQNGSIPLDGMGKLLHSLGWMFGPNPDVLPRHDEMLVKVVETLGKDADGKYAELEVIEIPEDVDYQVEEYDGAEWIAEKHRVWP